MIARRLAWFEAQPDLAPTRLVFIDETGRRDRFLPPALLARDQSLEQAFAKLKALPRKA